jgi:hypothetical protein
MRLDSLTGHADSEWRGNTASPQPKDPNMQTYARHHHGINAANSEVERPSLTRPFLAAAAYRPSTLATAMLIDVVDVLDFINAI